MDSRIYSGTVHCQCMYMWCICTVVYTYGTVDNYNPAYETRGALVDIYDGPAADIRTRDRSMIMTQCDVIIYGMIYMYVQIIPYL